MEKFDLSIRNKRVILALGAESAGNFSVYKNGDVHFSEGFGDLIEEKNFTEYKESLLAFLKKEQVEPGVILSDLHPLFRTTALAQELAAKYGAEYVPVQHHIAHIFSAIGDEIVSNSEKPKKCSPKDCFGIACDGTGYGFDEKIWGGEIYSLQQAAGSIRCTRIGHLENQILLGGELAVKEPARIMISILGKILSKKEVYGHVRKHYSRNEFELLWNQLEQNFNCLETSSTARILDAASVMLGFSKNERLSKHGPVKMLEENSAKPYALKPIVEADEKENLLVLKTTPLFEYLINNIDKDRNRLAATAQKYLADGLLRLIGLQSDSPEPQFIYFAGGMADNAIMSGILGAQGAYLNKKIPRGDAGISFGQIFYILLADPRN